YGLNPELAWLRCNILKIDRGSAFEDAVELALRMKATEPRHLQQQALLWRDNPALRNRLDEQGLVALALRLTTLEQASTAKTVVDELMSRNNRHPQLNQLRNRLARLAEPSSSRQGRPLAVRE